MLAQAAVLDGPTAEFTVRGIEVREPRPGEVLVAVRAVGMCHTDITARHSPIPLAFPVVLGHEGAGVVEAVGSGVTAVQAGDRVVLTYDSCGDCDNCHTGQPGYCTEFFGRNMTGRGLGCSSPLRCDGEEINGRWFGQSSFATHAIVGERCLVKVGDELPFSELAPLGCGVQTGVGAVVHTLGLRFGQSLVVYGAGAVGLSAVMAAHASGAREVIAVDLHESRRELALELGATRVYDGSDPELAAQVRAVTGGCDFALDTTGVPAVMNTALTTLRSRGMLGIVGSTAPKLSFATGAMATKRIAFLFEGDTAPKQFIPQLIALRLAGRLPYDRLITTFDFADINDAEAASIDGSVVKPVLVM
ncbi:NAD(P)-dependent alcohol dehydrogenase [Mycobacterium sp. HM-7]